MPPLTYMCHNCSLVAMVEDLTGSWDHTCGRCGQGFIEIIETPPTGSTRPPPTAPGMNFSQRTVNVPGMGNMNVFFGSSTSTIIARGGGGGPQGGGGGGETAARMVSMNMGGLDPYQLLASLVTASEGGFVGGAGGGGAGGGGGLSIGPGGIPITQAMVDQLMSEVMEQHVPPTHPTSKRFRDALPLLKVRPAPEAAAEKEEAGEGEAMARAGEQCPVCHDDFLQGEDVVELPCNHCYHKDCINPWLDTHNTCPSCRAEMPEERRQERRGDGTGSRGMRGSGGTGGGRQQHQHQQQGQHGQHPPGPIRIPAGFFDHMSGGGDVGGGGVSGFMMNADGSFSYFGGGTSGGSRRGQDGMGAPQPPPPPAPAAPQPPRSLREHQEEEGMSDAMIGAVLGGALGVLAGSAIANMFGSSRRSSQ